MRPGGPPRGAHGASAQLVTEDAPAGRQLAGASRFGALSVLGLIAVALGAVPFLGLLALVELRWAPLVRLDTGAAQALNDVVAARRRRRGALRIRPEPGADR